MVTHTAKGQLIGRSLRAPCPLLSCLNHDRSRNMIRASAATRAMAGKNNSNGYYTLQQQTRFFFNHARNIPGTAHWLPDFYSVFRNSTTMQCATTPQTPQKVYKKNNRAKTHERTHEGNLAYPDGAGSPAHFVARVYGEVGGRDQVLWRVANTLEPGDDDLIVTTGEGGGCG